ncbi:NADPH:quinone oxidoreductase family protein [Brevundimonas lutea]|uniref:NADPH:quinone oxidoreductase family protein n=1 Tax=Brevundimonas lutea TaxID=2293980 RepID=UPI000F0434AC|nr:NADPH:quinone oxidoreductase family protein [Brevundimonas lutea]
MKALLSTAPGGPETLALTDLPTPEPGRGEVRVAVKAVGINYPDTLIIEDRYQFRPPRPFAPGAELAGVVEAVGEGVTSPAVGDRVIAVPGWGALAEQVIIRADQTLPLPGSMSFEEGAALLMTYGTSYYALKNRAGLKAGESLLVLGAAGGVGAAAVELGKASGARVIAAVSSEDKLAFARELGANDGLIYPAGDLDRAAQKTLSEDFKRLSGGDGFDVVYDAVGGAYAEPALRALGWEGRYLVVGFPAGIPSIPLNLALLKSVQIMGVFWGAHIAREPQAHAENVSELMRLHAEGRIRPRISETWPLHQAGEAITALGDRRAMGKLVVTL